ncbi:MAG TPA: PQQ-binding-like beta-propeller repeat protein, partial [Thermoguttaceae bacterium]|nr:PQQ-binding-like beta-propeller repeat protein [Thermoguttaceae bacterium]
PASTKPPEEKPAEAKRANVLVVPLGMAGAARANPPAKPVLEEQQSRQKFFLPRADRLLVRTLVQAQEAIGQGRFAEAARILGEILAAPQDYAFQPDTGEPLYRTLKSEAARLLALSPPEALQIYQTLYEPRAKKALEEAIAARDTERLLTTAENFFFTSSGAEAMYLLGLAFLDRGQPVQAALVFQRLRGHPMCQRFEPMRSLLEASAWYRAGELPSAQTALEQLPPELRGAMVLLAGRQEKLFTQAVEGIGWLRTKLGLPALSASPSGWFFVHFNPAHNPAADVGPAYLQPLAHWPVCQEPIVARSAQQIRKKFFDELKPAMVQLYPLIVGRKVIFYTSTSLRAVDLDTGRLLWDAPMEDPLRLFLQPYRTGLSKSSPEEKPPAERPAESQSNLTGRILAGVLARQLRSFVPVSAPQEELDETNLSPEKLREILAGGVQERFWGETAFGLSSSDGRRVYGLEDLPFRFPVQFQRVVVTADGRRRPEPVLQKSYNLLVAYDIQTGKAIWEVGGPPDVEGMTLAGAYFLGPPIPLAGRLYVVALIEEETRLMELASDTGQVLNQLSLSGKQTDPNSHRAMLLAMGLPIDRFRLGDAPVCLPAYADGILVCRTAENHYVGVDLLSRSVRWIYEAAQEEDDLEGAAAMLGLVPAALRRAYAALKNQDDRWLEAGITIGEGYVLLTPPGSNKLLCLRLADGHRQWTLPRRDGLFVAAVADGRAVVVGRESLWAVRLQDGQPAWSSGDIALPTGAIPAGRGYRKGRYYYLPLTTAEVAAFDLEAGRLAARSRSPQGIVPGNLVACGQVILSQDVDGVYQWEILDNRAKQTSAALAQSPNDLQALLDHAEVLLAQGRWQKSLDLLERSKTAVGPAAQDQPRFQQLLTAAAQDAFQSDPEGFLARLNQIEALWKPKEFQTQILPLLARVYQQQGQIETAFEKYLALLRLISNPTDHQERISTLHTVRQDRWIAARLAELYQQASPEIRVRLEGRLAPWNQPDRLEEFVRYFGFHPDAQMARLQLAQRHVQAGRLVQAEWLLQTVFEQAQPAEQRLVAVRLAELYRKAGRHESALEVYRLLSGPWADLPCADGKTGRQLTEALPADDPVRRLPAAESPWPLETPKVEIVARPTPMRQWFFVLVDKKSS